MQHSDLVFRRFLRLASVSLCLMGTTACLPRPFLFFPGGSKGYEFLITLEIDEEVWDEALRADAVVGYGYRYIDDDEIGWFTVSPGEAWGVGFDDPEGFLFGSECRGSTVPMEFIGYAGPDVAPDLECDDEGCNYDEYDSFDPFEGFLEAPIAATPVVTATADCTSHGFSGDPETAVPVDLRLTTSGE